MKNILVVTSGIVAMILSTTTLAGPREDLLTQYAAAAKVTSFSAARGQTLHTQNFRAGSPIRPPAQLVMARTPGVPVGR
ncbi:MAG: hypothetical protein IPH08_10990 [Rhodocyclaceae bacterium]|nr:hypothetical protein [Rhodocyclaceae bacterium]